MNRPQPPECLQDFSRLNLDFAPAMDLGEWARETFLESGSDLYNEEHSHLNSAFIGWLWTNAPCVKTGQVVAGMCEIPNLRSHAWAKARFESQLVSWFGQIPDFLITIDAPLATLRDDISFCALIEHELYHAGQAKDEFGCPKYKKDGNPVFAMRGHDVEEFVGIWERYGASASAGLSERLLKVGMNPPTVAPASISAVCGTCLSL